MKFGALILFAGLSLLLGSAAFAQESCSSVRGTDILNYQSVLKGCQAAIDHECSMVPKNQRIGCSEAITENENELQIFKLHGQSNGSALLGNSEHALNVYAGCTMGVLAGIKDIAKFIGQMGWWMIQQNLKSMRYQTGIGLTLAEFNADQKKSQQNQKELSAFTQTIGQYIATEHAAQVNKYGLLGAAFHESASAVNLAKDVAGGPAALATDPQVIQELIGPVMKTVIPVIASFMAKSVKNWECLNGHTAAHYFCETVANFIIPPGALFDLLKGADGLILKNYPKIAQSIREIGEMMAAVKPAKAVVPEARNIGTEARGTQTGGETLAGIQRPEITYPKSGGKPYPERPLTPPRTTALEDYTARTGDPVKIVTPNGHDEYILDEKTNELLFQLTYKTGSTYPEKEFYFRGIDVHPGKDATGEFNAELKGQGFYSFLMHRMFEHKPGINLIEASLQYDNLKSVNDLVKEGYSIAEAIKGTPSYRVYSQNGFTDIDISSIKYGVDANGRITSLTYMVRRPVSAP